MTTTESSRPDVKPAEHFVAALDNLTLNAVHRVEI
jgi:hypothetical protein